jgi:hypothetical protein
LRGNSRRAGRAHLSAPPDARKTRRLRERDFDELDGRGAGGAVCQRGAESLVTNEAVSRACRRREGLEIRGHQVGAVAPAVAGQLRVADERIRRRR